MAQQLAIARTLKPALAVGLVVAGVYWYRHEPAARWRGTPAPAGPVQTTADLPRAFAVKDYTVTPLARYTATAVVLSRARYFMDRQAGLAPVDLALGWGRRTGGSGRRPPRATTPTAAPARCSG